MKPITILSAMMLLAYPFSVYYGLDRWGVTTVACFLVILFILRVVGGNQSRLYELKYIAWLSGTAGIILTSLAFVFKSSHWFTYYPVVVNLLMFILFVQSLFQEKTIIERFARLKEPGLPDYAVVYTRNVTKVWCLFFIVNAGAAFLTAFISIEVWTLYNGLISYFLAGSLFAVEFIVRVFVKRKNEKIA